MGIEKEMATDSEIIIRQTVLNAIIAKMPQSGHRLNHWFILKILVNSLSDLIRRTILQLQESADFVSEAKTAEGNSPMISEFYSACTDVYNKNIFGVFEIIEIMRMLSEQKAALKPIK